MLTSLQVYSSRVSAPPFPLGTGAIETDPIQIRDVKGLGPVNAALTTTPYATMDGGSIKSRSVGTRNIVLTLGLNPNWATQSIESLRMLVYNYFMPKSPVRMRFASTHMPTVEILGEVETCEPNIFSKDPEYQVSILCPKPNFVAIAATVITGTSTALNSGSYTTLDYEGTSDSGFQMNIERGSADNAGDIEVVCLNSAGVIDAIYLKNNIAYQNNSVAFDSTKYIDLSTVLGQKYVKMRFYNPPGQPYTLLNSVGVSSVWPRIRGGRNRIGVFAVTPGLRWTLTYFAKYGGL